MMVQVNRCPLIAVPLLLLSALWADVAQGDAYDDAAQKYRLSGFNTPDNPMWEYGADSTNRTTPGNGLNIAVRNSCEAGALGCDDPLGLSLPGPEQYKAGTQKIPLRGMFTGVMGPTQDTMRSPWYTNVALTQDALSPLNIGYLAVSLAEPTMGNTTMMARQESILKLAADLQHNMHAAAMAQYIPGADLDMQEYTRCLAEKTDLSGGAPKSLPIAIYECSRDRQIPTIDTGGLTVATGYTFENNPSYQAAVPYGGGLLPNRIYLSDLLFNDEYMEHTNNLQIPLQRYAALTDIKRAFNERFGDVFKEISTLSLKWERSVKRVDPSRKPIYWEDNTTAAKWLILGEIFTKYCLWHNWVSALSTWIPPSERNFWTHSTNPLTRVTPEYVAALSLEDAPTTVTVIDAMAQLMVTKVGASGGSWNCTALMVPPPTTLPLPSPENYIGDTARILLAKARINSLAGSSEITDFDRYWYQFANIQARAEMRIHALQAIAQIERLTKSSVGSELVEAGKNLVLRVFPDPVEDLKKLAIEMTEFKRTVFNQLDSVTGKSARRVQETGRRVEEQKRTSVPNL